MATLKQILGSAAFLGALTFGGLEAKAAEEVPAPLPASSEKKSKLFDFSFEQTKLSGSGSSGDIVPAGTDVDAEQYNNSTTATGSRLGFGLGLNKDWKFDANANAGYLSSKETLDGVSSVSEFDSTETRLKFKWYPTSSGWFVGPFYSERSSSVSGEIEEEPSSAFVIDPWGNIVPAVNTEYKTKITQSKQTIGVLTGYEGTLCEFSPKWSLTGGAETSIGKCTTKSKVKKSWHNDAEGTSGSESYSNEMEEYVFGIGGGINVEWKPTKNTAVSLGYTAEYQNWGGDSEADMKETTFAHGPRLVFSWKF